MRVLLILSFIISVFALFPIASFAQDKNGQCTVAAENYDFEEEIKMEFCNYYDRRFDYKRKRDQFRAQMDQRRANYQAQRQVVVDAYQAKERASHGF